MTGFVPQDPDFENRVRSSFGRQRVMSTIGATIGRIAPGEVDLVLPFRSDLTQQHGFVHGGIVATIADSACGYAAFTLMAADAGILTVEYKVNLVAPAEGDRLTARGRVLKPGRTLVVCQADVWAARDGQERLVATMLATMMAIHDRPGVRG